MSNNDAATTSPLPSVDQRQRLITSQRRQQLVLPPPFDENDNPQTTGYRLVKPASQNSRPEDNATNSEPDLSAALADEIPSVDRLQRRPVVVHRCDRLQIKIAPNDVPCSNAVDSSSAVTSSEQVDGALKTVSIIVEETIYKSESVPVGENVVSLISTQSLVATSNDVVVAHGSAKLSADDTHTKGAATNDNSSSSNDTISTEGSQSTDTKTDVTTNQRIAVRAEETRVQPTDDATKPDSQPGGVRETEVCEEIIVASEVELLLHSEVTDVTAAAAGIVPGHQQDQTEHLNVPEVRDSIADSAELHAVDVVKKGDVEPVNADQTQQQLAESRSNVAVEVAPTTDRSQPAHELASNSTPEATVVKANNAEVVINTTASNERNDAKTGELIEDSTNKQNIERVLAAGKAAKDRRDHLKKKKRGKGKRSSTGSDSKESKTLSGGDENPREGYDENLEQQLEMVNAAALYKERKRFRSRKSHLCKKEEKKKKAPTRRSNEELDQTDSKERHETSEKDDDDDDVVTDSSDSTDSSDDESSCSLSSAEFEYYPMENDSEGDRELFETAGLKNEAVVDEKMICECNENKVEQITIENEADSGALECHPFNIPELNIQSQTPDKGVEKSTSVEALSTECKKEREQSIDIIEEQLRELAVSCEGPSPAVNILIVQQSTDTVVESENRSNLQAECPESVGVATGQAESTVSTAVAQRGQTDGAVDASASSQQKLAQGDEAVAAADKAEENSTVPDASKNKKKKRNKANKVTSAAAAAAAAATTTTTVENKIKGIDRSTVHVVTPEVKGIEEDPTEELADLKRRLKQSSELAKSVKADVENTLQDVNNRLKQTSGSNKKVEVELTSDSDHCDHEDHGLTDEAEANNAGQPSDGNVRQSRSEKKARKAISKLGLKSVHGVVQVTIRRKNNLSIVISRPDVFVSARSSADATYIIFGLAKVEDADEKAKQEVAKKLAGTSSVQPFSRPVQVEQQRNASDEEEVTIDETGLTEKDIELVMSQAGVSRSRAVRALRDNSNDIVNAIMELTT